jgi:hypothetical protein
MRPQHHKAMPRDWSAEPEDRILGNLKYRRTRYGQGMTAPQSAMIRNMRSQEQFRQVQ